ncbi:hypothetical protein [Robbsia andropogonis]|uniref:hypothetical protein n=1 Tax=Robbsia andropogonis TaxID=28092 RepID=UPI002A6AFD70|nr:hypothetical protein [Robbsia andropogonis]
MPQNPIVPRAGGGLSVLNITAATVVKSSPGTIFRANVVVAGTAAGGVYDASATSGNTAANLVATLPDTLGPIELEFPCANGILIVPGTGQTIAVSYS